jgi:hypothetical protein
MSRTTRHDRRAGDRMLTASLLFGVAMLAVGGSLAWTIIAAKGEEGEAGTGPTISVCFSLLFLLGAVVYAFVAFGRLKWFYRCPRCRARLPRVPEPEAGAKVRYRCTACNIDWDTGWTEVEGGD